MFDLRRLGLVAVLALGPAFVACGHEGAYGDANSIIAAVPPELWAEVEQDVYDALEPRIMTVRDERTFRVTWQDPSGPEWGNMRNFRQLLLIGPASNPVIAEALDAADRENLAPPQILRAYNVWARGQTVTILLTPEEDQAEAVRNRIEELNRLYDEEYREYARDRMFITGRDSALADSLFRTAGFTLLVPRVYDVQHEDSVWIFRNDNPDPAELIRQVAVTWMSPIPEGMQGENLVDWRRDVADSYYSEPQIAVLDDRTRAGPIDFEGLQGYEVQAVWENTPEADWPAAGPFILRAVVCPEQDRMYMLDAWLYAPGTEKYEYMIQLQTILDSFRCGAP